MADMPLSARWPRQRFGPGATVVLAGFVAACAVGPRLTELSPWSPPAGQACRIAGPEGFLEMLVDSAALVAGIEGLDLHDGTLLLSVRVDSGEVEWVRQIDRLLPRSEARRITELVRDEVRAPADTVAWGRLVLRVAGSKVETLALEPSEVCEPALANPDEVADELEAAWRAIRLLGTTRLGLHVDATGRVTAIELERSSGRPAVDNAAAFAARIARFHPAIVDRHPVDTWVSLAFTLREDRATASKWVPSWTR